MQDRHVQHVRHDKHFEKLQAIRCAHSQIAALLDKLWQCVGPAVATLVSGVDALTEHGKRADNRTETQGDCTEEDGEHGHDEVEGGAHCLRLRFDADEWGLLDDLDGCG